MFHVEHKKASRAREYQAKYRRKKMAKGIVRLELQVSAEIKEMFLLMVENGATFDELVLGIFPDFKKIVAENKKLQDEIEALRPTLINQKLPEKINVPLHIKALPEDCLLLKHKLAQAHAMISELNKVAAHHKDRADRYNELLKHLG